MTRRVLMVHALGGMRGPARTLALLVPGIARSWDVDVAAPAGFLLAAAAEVPSVRTLALPLGSSRTRSWIGGSRSINGFVSRGPRPDLLHANGLSALNLVAPAALRHGIPVFVHFHGFETGRRARMLARVWSQLGLRVHLHPVSLRSREVLIASNLRPVGEIVPNPIAIPAASSHLSVAKNLRIGWVGSASPRKGLHVLVDIAAHLDDAPVRWLIFGISPDNDSPYVAACRERLSAAGLDSRVEWRGVVHDVQAAYQQIDVLLVPSLQESWCRVAMEGMASGLPVVGTDIPGMEELFQRLPAAAVFPVDRPEAGAALLRQVVSDTSVRTVMAESAREAMREFDVETVTSRLLHLYDRLLSQGKAEQPTMREA